jgi:UDP-glucuronate 4-epimerase
MFRDFTFIDDIVQGTVAAIDNPYPYEVFNIARGESVKLMSYINEIEKNLGRVAQKNMMPMQAGDVEATSADISKAKRMLDYNPQTSITEGVKKFIDWYKNYYKKF